MPSLETMGGNYGESFSDLEIAVSKHAEGSIEAAEQGYTKVLEREPSNSAALCNHAALLRDTKNDQAGAESLLRRALMADGAHIPSLYNLATLLWDVHRDAIGAEKILRRILALSPSDLPSLCCLGHILLLSNRLREASSLFDHALSLDADYTPCLLEYALLRRRTGELDQAVALLARVIQKDATNLAAINATAAILLEKGEAEAAVTVFQNCVTAHPHATARNPDFLSDLAGTLLVARKDVTHAERLFREALELEAHHVEALCGLGKLLHQERMDLDGAQTQYKLALHQDSEHLDTLLAYSLLLLQRKQYEQAEAVLARAYEIDPQDPEIARRYAEVLGSVKGEVDLAEAVLRSLVESHLHAAESYLSFAHSQRPRAQSQEYTAESHCCTAEEERERASADPGGGQPEHAFVNLKRGIRANNATSQLEPRAEESDRGRPGRGGGHVPPHVPLESQRTCADALAALAAFLHREREAVAEAEDLYRQALEAVPDHVPSLYQYGMMLDSNGKHDASEMLYRSLLQVEPGHVECCCRYGLLLDRHGHALSAEKMFQAALAVDDAHVDTLCAYGDLLARVRSDYVAAERLYKKALDLDPLHVDTLCSLSALLRLDGSRATEARRCLQTALRIAPQHRRVQELKTAGY